ncbi:amidohydrolase [Megasphaera sp. DJF_B143]|uniref:amidohydrolase n=1 Tax=Megasphaera sp. DJF_B143 TaxID=537288 RepID=UPI00073F1D1E|nr:amidohydrolase [Megasphaera sp. DJF_B143]KUH57484.1 amidohydrolase [Megasphaera sp. DJF_B143]MCI5531547.1 amidohydrolase [Caecibacter massiliensis]
MTKEELKQKVCDAIDKRAEDIMSFGTSVFDEPELGYKETKTSAKVQEAMDKLGIPYTTGWAITGVKGRLKGKNSKRTVAVMGELDSIVCRRHPSADPITGAAHCCGHFIQISDMLGVAMALKDAGAMDYLGGDVVFFAVPSEECIEIEYRKKLMDEGKIHFFGGKQEIILQGGFDDIDAAMEMHAYSTDDPEGNIILNGGMSGFITKLIEYHGKAAHAAGQPHLGINALNACMLGIMGVNALRETFQEKDHVRFHPIITSGGDLVNVVPDLVRMESYVRAASADAMKFYNDRINRALRAGADAIGATCEIKDMPGYLPMEQDKALGKICEANADAIFGKDHVDTNPPFNAGSTDVGDICNLMPCIHPHVGCVHGALHSAEFELFQKQAAYIKTTKVMAMTVIDLLYDNAAGLEDILKDYKPRMTKEQYLAYMDSLRS